ncbi:MAG TPA: Rv0909 family putative TA system antitoxin [Actinocrinis sp.]|nr:Rv0909 family putative TA system antitoxin [Actinocrinis sp.]
MSQWSDEIQKAEQLAKDHPQQADEALQKGEQFAEDRTDHRFDKQIGAAGDQVEQRYGGGQQGQDQGQQDPQNQGQQQDQDRDQGQQ